MARSVLRDTFRRRRLLIFTVTGVALVGFALGVDEFGPPPPGDPSAFTGPSVGLAAAIDYLATLAPANEGALEGGDPSINGFLREDQLRQGGGYDIPTGGPPSPMFGAGPFEQRMLLFEEFGPQPLGETPTDSVGFPLPSLGPSPAQDPDDLYASGPNGQDLEDFLAEPGLAPAPRLAANTEDTNPWEPVVEDFLGRDLLAPPAEGRPPGKGWSHQRWYEFHPRAYVKTAQAGARENLGFRDALQRHGYRAGEFGPGGLYHTVYASDVPGAATVDGTTQGLDVRFHPHMPVQHHESLWTFDGTVPPKLVMARYGEPLLFRHYNALPIDPSANRGFGLHTLTTHEHNGHNPSESDGYANAFFFPGQFYDYRWPMQLAGHDTVNTTAEDPRAAMPCTPGERVWTDPDTLSPQVCGNAGAVRVRGDWRETMSTHWFHDHMLDFTAQNVYKGNAAMMNYYSAVDRGNESWEDGVNLRLPSGNALAWGNRDYDVNLVLADKAWDATGQLWFNIFNTDGFLGDQLLVNWLYKPYFDVRARRYRFRILNGSVARYFALALVREVAGPEGAFAGPPGSGVSYEPVGFHLVANDGNLMEHALPFDGTMDLDHDGDLDEHAGALPTQAIGERFDIVVDFTAEGIHPGDRLYFINTMEHQNGKKPNGKIPLADILSGAYAPARTEVGWVEGDPVVGAFLELRVVPHDGVDPSMDPAAYVPGGLKMVPLPIDRNDPALQTARHRTFDFGRSSGTDSAPWTVKTDGGAGLVADPRRVSAAPQLATGPTPSGTEGTNLDGYDELGTLETWELRGNGGWSHPIHVHFEEGVVLSRDGGPPADWEWWSRKDIYKIGPEEDASHNVEIAMRFREFAGSYVEHCHNTQHEDHAMLLRWDLEHPGQIELMPAPLPSWDGVEYVDSHALPTFRTGNGIGTTWEIPSSNQEGVGGNTGGTPVNDRPFTVNEGHVEPLPGREPLEPDLMGVVVDRDAAIVLGKALFWDAQVGSDGVACASCHFSAGADPRVRNQVNPGGDGLFGGIPQGRPVFDVNETLTGAHFPLHVLADPDDADSDILADADDRVASQGSFGGVFTTVGRGFGEPDHAGHRGGRNGRRHDAGEADEACVPERAGPFFVHGLAHRHVEGRSTPSVVNAVFNLRNFWDGRASGTFNATDSFGDSTNIADATAGVLVARDRARPGDAWRVALQKMAFPSSSLASQALAPPLDSFEMACDGVTFPMIARRLLDATPLAGQKVSLDDSVFGPAGVVRPSRQGLTGTYRDLIQRAFHRSYWQATGKYAVASDGTVSESRTGNRQIEENFPLFFGLAIQAYESTLVSDDSPFDRDALSAQEARGRAVFERDGMCADCHAGALLSNATAYAGVGGERVQAPLPRDLVERMGMGDGTAAAYDVGFYNIGARPTFEDLGIGARDPWGIPFSIAERLFASGRTAVDGAFKVPSLRNVGLTAPYFHHGGAATLEEVIAFYDRGGDRRGTFRDGDTTGYGENRSNAHLFIQPLGLTETQRLDLLAFLLSLTDYRVACHEAPFDHPSLRVTNGHEAKDRDRDGRADDIWVTVPAVGARGLPGIGKACMPNSGDLFGGTQEVLRAMVSSP
ncbi:MAG: hypothetical protein RLZZ299_2174 [Pseudomonadota bacterium]|jgi:cytochrome c peroxidase/FtsP/CotA-like multicopper oxidase with cupredoxin domain